jgi:FtsP/CotA-like multicopper oxidase with cupredoxin domain
MQSTAARIGVLVAMVAAAVVLFIVLSGGDDNGGKDTASSSASTSTATSGGAEAPTVITVQNGAPVGGVQKIEVNKGDRVNLEVRLDQPEEEVHVHGYEIEKPAQTSPVRISFPADIDGLFEVEVHEEGGGEFEIAELRVNP